MKSLRIRFAIGFCLLFTALLTIAFVIIYISNASFRKEDFFRRMKDRSLTTFRLMVEVERIDHDLLKEIDRNTLNSLYDEKIMVYEGTTLIYSSFDSSEIKYDPALLEKARTEKEFHTTRGDAEVVAFYIEQDGKNFTIMAEAYDDYGRRKLTFLKWVMVTMYFAGISIGWVATYFFVKRIIQPLESLKKNIQQISSANLHTRLSQSGQGEEVDSLATSFNQLLERLQQSFSIQKDFVHYASHELRTPLAAMVGVTENALNKKLDNEHYQLILEQLFQQQQELTRITNSLLLLSDNKIIRKRDYPSIRLDELVFRSVEIVQNIYPNAEIRVSLEGKTAQEEAMLVHANEPLLLMAFTNLLRNALQYSEENEIFVTARFYDTYREVEFKNPGKGLTEEETKLIFTPFFRASNSGSVKGHGLGLALVKQIAEIHTASIEYKREDTFNVFVFRF